MTDTNNACTDSIDLPWLLGQALHDVEYVPPRLRIPWLTGEYMISHENDLTYYLFQRARRASRLSSPLRADEALAPTPNLCPGPAWG